MPTGAQSETGHAKNVANFNTMKTICTLLGANYNPVNTAIVILTLDSIYNASDTAVRGVRTPSEAFMLADDNRFLGYHDLKHLTRRSFSALKSSPGVTPTAISDAQTLVDKITGDNVAKHSRAHQHDEPTVATHSVSQQSFDMVLSHFNDLITVYTNSSYQTNDADLAISALSTFATGIFNLNNVVNSTYLTYSQAMKTRDTLLYKNETGLLDIAKKVKDYVKSTNGISATEKALILALEFRRPNEDELHF